MSKILITLYVLTTSVALIVLKLSSKTIAPVQILEGKLQFHINGGTVAGVVLYGISFLLYMYLISRFDLGYIIPLTTALVYIIIFTASFVVFNEAFTALKVSGITLIVIGLVLLNLKK